MKLIRKLMVLALVGGIVGLFFFKTPNGKPVIDWKDFIPDQITETMKKPAPTLYRWKDDKGNWQYSDTPPEDQTANVVTNSTPVNTMKTIELPEGYQDQPRRAGGIIVGEGGSDIRRGADRTGNNRSYSGDPATWGEKESDGMERGSDFDPTSGASPLSTAPLGQVPNMLNEIERIQSNQENKQKILDNLR